MHHIIPGKNWLSRLIFSPLMLSLTDGGDGGAGGAAGGDSGTILGGGGGSGDPAGGANTPPPSTDIRTFIDEKGNLGKGWAKTFGGNDSWEGKYTSLASLVGAHKNLETMLGRDKVPVPTENSPQEEWDAFYSKIGRPEKPDGYEIKRPDGLDESLWDDKRTEGFQAIAHKIGLTPKQAQELAAWELEYVGGQVKTMTEKADAEKASSSAALRKDWGAEYDTKMKLANTAAKQVGGDALITNPALANNPDFIRAMAKVGEMISEAGDLPGARSERGSHSASPKSEIERIMSDKNDPYWSGSDPRHAERVKYVSSLYEKMYAKT